MQKRPLQPDEHQSINDSAKDSLLKLMKTAYAMVNFFCTCSTIFADIKLSLYLLCHKPPDAWMFSGVRWLACLLYFSHESLYCIVNNK